MYDLYTGELLKKYPGHKSVVRDCVWHPTENEIVTSSVIFLEKYKFLFFSGMVKRLFGSMMSGLRETSTPMLLHRRLETRIAAMKTTSRFGKDAC